MFWFTRNRTVELNCYIKDKTIYNNYPITLGNKILPKWFKTAETYLKTETNRPFGTIKACPAVQNYLFKSIVMPLWTDFNIHNQEDTFSIEIAYALDNKEAIDLHKVDQWKMFADAKKEKHIKIHSPWVFETKDKVDFLFTESFYHNSLFEDMQIIPGIVDYKINSATHINLFVSRNIKHKFIEAGTPMVNLIPLTEKPVKVINHLVSNEKYKEIQHAYGTSKFFKKHLTKCPFHK